jgi:hypothetical protein
MRIPRESGSSRAIALTAILAALVVLQVCVVGAFELLFPTLLQDFPDGRWEDRTAQVVQGR